MFRLILLLTTSALIVEAYKVLVVFPVPSHSHAALGRGIVKAIREHMPNSQVTFITSFPRKDPPKGVTEVDLSHIQALATINMADESNRKPDFNLVKSFSKNITRMMFETPSVQEVLKKGQFDAVITEWFFSDAYAGLAPVLQCPWLQVSGTVIHPHLEMILDTVSSPAVYPLMTEDLPIPMNFLDRVKNTFVVAMMMLDNAFDKAETAETYNRLFQPIAKARGVILPEYDVALHNTSILFVNSHPSVSHAQSLPPNVVEIGGYHIDEVTPKLPEDLQKFLDNAKEGVVYFSMGSVLKSSKLPLQMRKEILQVLGEIPYTVLWKFEENLDGLPSNVHIMKWVPQQSVLAHPNVKVFITHGGLLSTLEAVHFGVPLIAVPVFGDQPANADRAVRNGFAVKVPYSEDIAKHLRPALNEILGNKKYYNKAQELSKLFRSRPTTPSKTIAHYVQLAIESKGALHLRSKSRLYPLFQRVLLDQLAVVLGAVLLVYLVVKRLFRRNVVVVKKGKKKN